MATTMLRSLVGGNQGAEEQDEGKLLQLADRGEETEQPTPSSQQEPDDVMLDDGQEVALASVITQVSSRDQQKAVPPPSVQYAVQPPDDASAEVRSTWKNKFR